MLKHYVPLVFTARSLLVYAINGTDSWSSVSDWTIVQELHRCAQPCIENISQQISHNDNTYCQSYDCVCAASADEQSFQEGLAGLTNCTKDACPLEKDVEDARNAYENICIIHAAQSAESSLVQGDNATFITGANYQSLSACAKFVLNGCTSTNGDTLEDDCGPVRKWQYWEDYNGVAAERRCTTAECLCNQTNFDETFSIAYSAGEKYCNMSVSTESLPNEDYEAMQAVLATYCAAATYPPRTWSLRLVGLARPSNSTNETGHNQTIQDSKNGTNANPEPKLDGGEIAGVVVGGLSFIVAVVTLYYTRQSIKLMLNQLVASNQQSEAGSGNTGEEISTSGESQRATESQDESLQATNAQDDMIIRGPERV
ncbi:hypothetical protein BDV96DRAFT_653142 [Lophiotrema nucula]|uniref:Extracellular membrane protein CFEM domain-containing protein n=1 Tax=Lophiotrema nucula TaxID=690887 RepID=A0A6A5YMR3_9PLEO|nr:hypothetical protein BDV96DRAFT_653142 [Lophiotrema nucula]